MDKDMSGYNVQLGAMCMACQRSLQHTTDLRQDRLAMRPVK